MSHCELRADLDEVVTARIVQPDANRMADAVRDDIKATGPIDTGLLRALAASEHDLGGPTVAAARVVSSRPTDDGTADAAAWVEFGTRFMQPRRYVASSAQRAVQHLGYGRYTPRQDPWPHKP